MKNVKIKAENLICHPEAIPAYQFYLGQKFKYCDQQIDNIIKNAIVAMQLPIVVQAENGAFQFISGWWSILLASREQCIHAVCLRDNEVLSSIEDWAWIYVLSTQLQTWAKSTASYSLLRFLESAPFSILNAFQSLFKTKSKIEIIARLTQQGRGAVRGQLEKIK